MVYLDFLLIPDLVPYTASFHFGSYDKNSAGYYVVREVAAYPSALDAAVARFAFALAAGLPLGILLHTICWASVVEREKRDRIAAFPAQGAVCPRPFIPTQLRSGACGCSCSALAVFFLACLAGSSIIDGFMTSETPLGCLHCPCSPYIDRAELCLPHP